ncbi:hypothetical protein [Nitrosopumilus sp.]
MSRNETRQLEPQKNLVESIPVKESIKLSANTEPTRTVVLTWEDLRGVF